MLITNKAKLTAKPPSGTLYVPDSKPSFILKLIHTLLSKNKMCCVKF